ncbi:hypothetical protein RUND412_001786 [Rhizina undulata]
MGNFHFSDVDGNFVDRDIRVKFQPGSSAAGAETSTRFKIYTVAVTTLRANRLKEQKIFGTYSDRKLANKSAREALRTECGMAKDAHLGRLRKEYEESMDNDGFYAGCVYLKEEGESGKWKVVVEVSEKRAE